MFRRKLNNRKYFVDVITLFYAIGAWVGVNSIFVQLPLIVNSAPEKWNLPAHLVMVVQLANIGPILYSLFTKYLTNTKDHYIIYGLLGIGTLSIYILSSVYDKTTVIFGNEHSTVLFSFMFIAAFVGCTSPVLFMPYMRNYKEIYLVSYLVGEGLSGCLPSILALIQGVGGNPECVNITKLDLEVKFETRYPDPRFSSSTFFIFIGTLLLLSFLSFVGLNKLDIAKREKVKLPASAQTLPTDVNAPPNYKTTSEWSISKHTYYLLLFMMSIIALLGNGVLPSIQSYSCLPYGNVVYHLTVTLAFIAGPLTMCSGFFIKNIKVNLLSWLIIIYLLLSSIVFYLALQSPRPPLQGSWLGEFLIILLWIFINGIQGFLKMGITTIIRLHPGKGLYYTGVAIQSGSIIGAVITFVLLNYTTIFRSYSPCNSLTSR